MLAHLMEEHRGDEWRLHGMYAEKCVSQFGVQALCYFTYGQLWGIAEYPHISRIGTFTPVDAFLRSRIRLGSVIAGTDLQKALQKSERPEKCPALEGIPILEMVDSRTRIYGL
jgi:hypothetical protein